LELIKADARFFTGEQVGRICSHLDGGAVGVMPTDTVYGLVAPGADRRAVLRVLEIKGRPPDKPLPLLVSGPEDALRLAFAGGAEARRLMDAFWPGPLTLVMKRRPGFTLPAQDEETIGLRMPECPLCIAVIERSGFIVAPSANRSGARAPASFAEVDAGLLEDVEFAVDAGACPGGRESTVVDLTCGIRILREGAVPAERVMKVAAG